MADRGKGFPRLSLASAIQIIEKASKFGKTWPKGQFAGFGSKGGAGSAKSGAFAARISSLRDFGLVMSDKDTVSLTELAMKITKPISDDERSEAIKIAFMNVETFGQLYNHFDDNIELALTDVAQHAVFNLGISRESKDKFIAAFIESGRFVGLVNFSKEANTISFNKETATDAPNGMPVAAIAGPELNSSAELIQPGAHGIRPKQFAGNQSAPLELSVTEGSEQGVSHRGAGWSLTVALKTAQRLDAPTRKIFRELIDKADELADKLYILDQENESD